MYENLNVTVLTIFYLCKKCVSYVYMNMNIIEHILREIVNYYYCSEMCLPLR